MNASAKLACVARMTTDRLLRRHLACPNCDATDHIVVDRKYLVTELRRCRSCRLLFLPMTLVTSSVEAGRKQHTRLRNRRTVQPDRNADGQGSRDPYLNALRRGVDHCKAVYLFDTEALVEAILQIGKWKADGRPREPSDAHTLEAYADRLLRAVACS